MTNLKTTFLKSLDRVDQIDYFDQTPEILMLGRSNSGKSTLINNLTKSRQAKTSSKPGSTTCINFYQVEFLNEEQKEIRLIDFPGFGYAKFSKKKREEVSKNIIKILHERENIKVCCLLIDSKREPEIDEISIVNTAFNNGIIVKIIITKLDRLNQKEKNKQIKLISSKLNLETTDLFKSDLKKTNYNKMFEDLVTLT